MTATDNLLHPTHCVQEAQGLAAELFGAAATFYTGGGATTAIAAMILAAVPPGGTILLPRNVHRSVASALVMYSAIQAAAARGGGTITFRTRRDKDHQVIVA